MGSFGDRLRREREMRGITLVEISESTKISQRHLLALEGEDFNQLPGGIFNKGFVRAYARYLGIDEDQAVAEYVEASNEQPAPENQFPLEVREQPDPQLNPKRSRLPLVFAVAALAGVLLGYAFWVRSKPRITQAAESAPPAHVTASVSPAVTAHPPEAGPAAGQPAPAIGQVAVRNFTVVVTAKEDSWVSITADGKSQIQKTLRAGNRKVVRAGKQVVLLTRNAGGIDVSYNGKPLGAIGNENEVRTMTFTPAGRVQ
jgi:cytoskeleton protein RodZ